MKFNFKNKFILVTGSTKGIGLNTALYLTKLGGNVIFNSRSNNFSLPKLKALNYIKADVSDEIDAKKLFIEIKKRYGLIDHIVCNVGDGRLTKEETGSPKELDIMLRKNLYSTVNVVNAGKKILKKNTSSIVCISSIAGVQNVGAPVGYQVAKASLNMYVKSMATQLSKKGIRINSIAPGNILFKGSTWEEKIKMNKSEIMKMINKEVILKRFGTPEEISMFIIFLLSKFSSFSTGQTFLVDGGQIKSI